MHQLTEDDEDYVEGECVSFLKCYDGNVWRKQVDNGYKYLRITNNITNIWLENFLFDTTRQCTLSSVDNQTSVFDVILLENDISQMTYVLDDTPDGDIVVTLNITADNHLSVNYDYNNDLLDNADYFELSTIESLNEYLNTFSTCTESQTDTDLDGVGNNADTDDDGDGHLDTFENDCGSDSLNATSIPQDMDGDE